ncbi:hypothetical protein LCGC14_2185190 [marine sediment metagenome]|uniref:Uncharacterized protein n=1 Tax=marine sediment metagenome TaxID=412755 RepID=A0A0F9DL37_9ZZZZ
MSKKEAKENYKKRKIQEFKVFQRFVIILSVVSILGFASVLSETLFNFIIKDYVEALWMFILGIGLIMEVRLQRLRSIYRGGLTRDNFTYIITIIIGLFAIFAGIFSIPAIRINSPSFIAIKGILAIIAISIIIIQTWFIRKKHKKF